MNNNDEFAYKFLSIFGNELVHDFSKIANFSNQFFLLSKEEIVFHTMKDAHIIFPGFGRKMSLLDAIDEYEFLLAILSFFNQYGKLYRTVEYIDNKYKEFTAISFYNPNTNSIEVIQRHTEQLISEISNVHLFWLQNTKENIFLILKDFEQKKITSTLIKQNHHKFIEAQENEREANTTSI